MTILRTWAPPAARAVLALLAAGVAAGLGYGLVALAVTGTAMAAPEEQSAFGAQLALAGVLWSAPAHGVMLTAQRIDYTLVPWGLTLGIAVVAYGSAAWWARIARVTTPLQYLLGVVVFTLGYAALVGGGLVLTRSADWAASWPRAAAQAAVLALIAGGLGAHRASGVDLHIRDHVPDWLIITLRAAAVAVVALIGAGALLMVSWIIARFADVLQVQTMLGGGVAGAGALLVITLAYLPTLLIWAVSYLLGAGFSLGSDSLISPFLAVTPGTDVPLVPVIAAFPSSAAPVAWLYPCSAVACGLLAGYLIARRSVAEAPLMKLVMALLGASLAAGAIAGLTWLASGSLGQVSLVMVGALPEFTGALAWIGFVVGMVPAALLIGRRRPALALARPAILEDVPVRTGAPR